MGIFKVARYTLPFFFMMVVAVAIVTIFPGVVTWLPATMLSG
jgi:TRAP-type C4-dicarboxylate transport system permease large subunit